MYKALSRRVNLQYKALHGFYWMLYCLPTGYITVFLLSHGFSSSLIGSVTALSSMIAAAGQLAVGNMADKSLRLNWKSLLLILGAVQAAALVLLLFFRDSHMISGILFPLFLILMYFQMPLVNASIFYYSAKGLKLDFGSARGTGSLSYAFISFAAGQLVVRTGEIAVVYLSLAVLTGLMIITGLMPSFDFAENRKDSENTAKVPSGCDNVPSENSAGIPAFAARYPDFMLVLLGSILVMAFHNIGHTYMIQMMEAVGGSSASMGTAFSMEAVMELPVMFGFYKLIAKYSPGALMITANTAFFIKALAYFFADSVMMLYAAQILQMFSNALFASASVYYANEKMRPADQVTGQSYMTASISIGAVLGNFLGGLVLSAAGVKIMLLAALGLAFTGALITIIGVRYQGRGKEKKPCAGRK